MPLPTFVMLLREELGWMRMNELPSPPSPHPSILPLLVDYLCLRSVIRAPDPESGRIRNPGRKGVGGGICQLDVIRIGAHLIRAPGNRFFRDKDCLRDFRRPTSPVCFYGPDFRPKKCDEIWVSGLCLLIFMAPGE